MAHLINKSEQQSLANARAKRVQTLRLMTRLSRHEFEKKFKISASTLQNWEDVKISGLTEKGAQRLIAAFKSLGIECTLGWLMHGVGNPPQLPDTLYATDENPPSISNNFPSNENEEIEQIAQELLFFRRHYPSAIDLVIKDDGMLPQFLIGDYVAGVPYYQNDIQHLLGFDCIVEIQNGTKLLRGLQKGNAPDRYTLFCKNPQTMLQPATLYDVQVISAAPVMWIRRKNPLINK